jgi:putative flippase GtrA
VIRDPNLHMPSAVISPQLVKYGAASGFSFCMSLGLSVAFRWLGLSSEVAFAVTLATMVCINFAVLGSWVFRSVRGSRAQQFSKFVMSSLGFRSAEFVAFLVLHTWMAVPYTLSVVLILGASAIAKFLVLRGFVFAR